MFILPVLQSIILYVLGYFSSCMQTDVAAQANTNKVNISLSGI